MLKKHAQFFESLFFISDLIILSATWLLSCGIHFYVYPVRLTGEAVLPLLHYVEFLFPLWIAWGVIAKASHFYHTRRIEYFSKEFLDIIRGLSSVTIALMAFTYLLKWVEVSRWAFFYFWVLSVLGLLSSRYFIRRLLRQLRKKGYNQRFAVIAGTGELGQRILKGVELHPELGIQVVGFLTHDEKEVGKSIESIPITGVYEDIHQVFGVRKVDIFFVALPITQYNRLAFLLGELQNYSSDIKVIPGVYEFLGLRGGVDELDDLPIVSLQSTPLYGWSRVSKRIFDLLVGGLILLVVSPLMMVFSLLIKLTSKGPILYRQERVGMDGHLFEMLKFRTMRADAEKETGPIWAKENDSRRTRIGAFLRRTSLDELPQLFNVIKGEMSLVGPRPERPIFVEEFRDRIPSYMLRHKIKAGMTGWAQVNGWRGNTSLERRIEHDLYYIQNWSMGFDLIILFRTLSRGFFSKSAY